MGINRSINFTSITYKVFHLTHLMTVYLENPNFTIWWRWSKYLILVEEWVTKYTKNDQF